MIRVERYALKDKTKWDDFCRNSLNSVFLFYRDYMDYHRDRFSDHSLLFYRNHTLLALLPCNERTEASGNGTEKILSAHDGLTFGSFIMGTRAHQMELLECVDVLMKYCRENGISEVKFKPVPPLLQKVSSEQDVYALIRSGAALVKSEPSVITRISGYAPCYSEKRYCRCAENAGLVFKECEDDNDWKRFHGLLTCVLDRYHGVSPVHSLPELLLLHHRFPEEIKLFAVFGGENMLAGTVVYEYNHTVHTQYMASDEEGRKKGALHFCIQNLIGVHRDKDWLDFGISTEDGGRVLNEGLLRFKENFRGNTILYNTWRLKIK